MIVVTGCAGFVGSHLTERLLSMGFSVTGIDRFSDYYPKSVKKKNMEGFVGSKGFRFVEGDLAGMSLKSVLKGAEVVFHQAAQAGVRRSWGDDFSIYVRDNVIATQRLLEACKDAKLRRFVNASSSSVYGDAEKMPTDETALPAPVSPYGATKLTGESLCHVYWKNYGVPTVSLRYFTAYGPRQRPDMGFHKFITAAMKGGTIEVYGSGGQTRDFTYISDVVEANVRAMEKDCAGEVFNIGGGSRISVSDVLGIIGKATGKKLSVRHAGEQRGDARHTSADISKAKRMLGYAPSVGIEDGIRRQADWMRNTA